MKVTKRQLKRIIREEKRKIIKEQVDYQYWYSAGQAGDDEPYRDDFESYRDFVTALEAWEDGFRDYQSTDHHDHDYDPDDDLF